MGKKLNLTADDARDMQALYDGGMSVKNIAAKYGISDTAVKNRVVQREREYRHPDVPRYLPADFPKRWNEARFRLMGTKRKEYV